MKRIKSIVLATLVAAVSVQFSACTSDEEVGPANEINDSKGINIQLEWSTGRSATQSLSEADLDLYLMLKGDDVQSSNTYAQFESVGIPSFFTDGSYVVSVAYAEGNRALDYSLYVSGASEGSKEILYEGVFAASDEGAEIDDITITKVGNKYTIID